MILSGFCLHCGKPLEILSARNGGDREDIEEYTHRYQIRGSDGDNVCDKRGAEDYRLDYHELINFTNYYDLFIL